MKILEYKYSDKVWDFQKVEFQNINLIVGDSGTGKTRLLNTIFNAGAIVAQKQVRGVNSHWDMTLSIGDNRYAWKLSTVLGKDNFGKENAAVEYEELHLNDKRVFLREKGNFIFQEKSAFKIPSNETAISALREEDVIAPLYTGFSRILRRNFFTDEVEKNAAFQTINNNLLTKLGRSKNLTDIFEANLGLNLRLFLLKTYLNDVYKKIVSLYMSSFKFIKETSIINSDKLEALDIPFISTPVFCVREHKTDKWIRLDELSSGMQKTLLIITDLISMPDDVIYLIDEYENSLGIGPISVLPEILFFEETKKQIFITSHHPYIIPKFPIENWFVAHRKGSQVKFAYGSELISRYEMSKQDRYLQLINDPFYSEGVE